MDGDATQESQVPQVVDEGEDDGKEKAGGKKSKRKFVKPEDLSAFYNPAAYAPQKGGRGKGPKGEGKGDREGGKGKGKNRDYYNESPQKEQPQDEAVNSPPSVAPGPVPPDGDGSQPKGGASAKKKSSNKGGRGEGKGSNKGGASGGKSDAPKKGGGRGGGGGGKAKGGPLADMPEQPMLEVEGPRAPGPQQQQQRPPMPMKGMPAALPNVSMVPQMAAPFNSGVPFNSMPPGGMPFAYQQMQGMVAMPGAYFFAGVPPQAMGMGAPPQQFAIPGGVMSGPPMANDTVATITKARLQIEHYFSVENLLKDMFLRKNMNSEGWVPIDLIAGWPALQKTTQDRNSVVQAIEGSTIVEANDQKSHLRLRSDWEKWVIAGEAPGAGALRPPA